MIVVSNSSPIITFIKIKKLDLLIKLFDRIYITQDVYDEGVEKKELSQEIEYFEKFSDAFALETLTHSKKFENLGKGESSTIELAIKKKANLAIIDDYDARVICKTLQINVTGTLGVLLIFVKKKWISIKEFKKTLDVMIAHKFRIHIELYNEVLREAEKYSRYTEKS